MPESAPGTSRRRFLAGAAAAGVTVAWPSAGQTARAPVLRKTVPTTGEALPVIGMGTWLTFDVGRDPARRDQRVEVLRRFFEMGGGLVDSSPMYGSSEAVIGYCLERLQPASGLFSATKVWTRGKANGVEQMAESERLWGVDRFDLLQIHNLVGWETHLETLLDWKANGRVGAIGITTSHGRRHREFEAIMAHQPIDFVQLTYNILDRRAEQRLLPLAAERGLAVIANRPFRGGALFGYFAHHPLPDWAGEIDCANWAQLFLKFIVSHPAVTCAIPATRRVDHMEENMGALRGMLPDPELRARMVRNVEDL